MEPARGYRCHPPPSDSESTDTFTAEGRYPEAGMVADPAAQLSALQQRAEQLVKTAALLNTRLAEQQAAYERIESVLSEHALEIPDA